jgi:hypothetical protein
MSDQTDKDKLKQAEDRAMLVGIAYWLLFTSSGRIALAIILSIVCTRNLYQWLFMPDPPASIVAIWNQRYLECVNETRTNSALSEDGCRAAWLTIEEEEWAKAWWGNWTYVPYARYRGVN